MKANRLRITPKASGILLGYAQKKDAKIKKAIAENIVAATTRSVFWFEKMNSQDIEILSGSLNDLSQDERLSKREATTFRKYSQHCSDYLENLDTVEKIKGKEVQHVQSL